MFAILITICGIPGLLLFGFVTLHLCASLSWPVTHGILLLHAITVGRALLLALIQPPLT